MWRVMGGGRGRRKVAALPSTLTVREPLGQLHDPTQESKTQSQALALGIGARAWGVVISLRTESQPRKGPRWGFPGGLDSGVEKLQEVTSSGGLERWAIAPSSPTFVTTRLDCQKELQHSFLKCFPVARTARCSESRASGKSCRHRAEVRRGEHSQCELSVEPEAVGNCSPGSRRLAACLPARAAELPRCPPPAAARRPAQN